MSWTEVIVPIIVALPGLVTALIALRKARADATDTITKTILSLIQPLKDENQRLSDKVLSQDRRIVELESMNRKLRNRIKVLEGKQE